MCVKFCSMICGFCFTVTSLAYSQGSENIESIPNAQVIEMKVFEVVKVHDFKDPDKGAFFTLNDGSKWLRTWWEGPIYYLDVGQSIALIPMTDKEAIDHKRGWFQDYRPFWIILSPKEDQSVVGIAFEIK